MTNESILEAVHTWAKEQGLNCEAMILSKPPALLDLRPTMTPEELPEDSSGVCLTIWEPEATNDPPASLACWVPISGKGGSYLMCREGDDEIGTAKKDWFQSPPYTFCDEEEVKLKGLPALILNLRFKTRDFHTEYVWKPALEQWLSSKGLTYDEDGFGHGDRMWDSTDWETTEADIENSWTIFSYRDPVLGKPYRRVIGVSGYGEVAAFHWPWAFSSAPCKIRTPSDLYAWLDARISLKAEEKKEEEPPLLEDMSGIQMGVEIHLPENE